MSGNEVDLSMEMPGASLSKYGIFLFMDTITDSSCKEAIEFIIKQNLGKTKLKHLNKFTTGKNWARNTLF